MLEILLLEMGNLLLLMFSLAIVGEPLRALASRCSRLFRDLDAIQVLVLNVLLGGFTLYLIIMIPLQLFRYVTILGVLLFSIFFVAAELLLKQAKLPQRRESLKYIVVLCLFLITLYLRLIPISDLTFGSIRDTSLHSLFAQLILENRQVPTTFRPYSPAGVIYPLGFHPIIAYAVQMFDYLVPNAVLQITTLLGAMSVLGAYYLGKTLSSKWHFGFSLALASAFVAAYPKFITWGSNALVASVPLYFVCLGIVPSLLKEKQKFSISELVVVGVLFGYLGAVHLQPYETLMVSIGLWWLLNVARRKQRALWQIRYILAVFIVSLIVVSPFLYRWLIWYPYPYHNIGLPVDIEIPVGIDAPYTLSNFKDISHAILQGINSIWAMSSPYVALKVVYFTIVFLILVIAISKRRDGRVGSEIVRMSLVTVAGQIGVLLLAVIFPYALFSPQVILLFLSLDMLIAVLGVWVYRSVLLRLSKTAVMKISRGQHRWDEVSNSKALRVALLAGMLVYAPFVCFTVFSDRQEIRGAYGVWAITTRDDLELMLWIGDNLPQKNLILVNQYECGLFIPSISHLRVVYPSTAVSYSRSYQTLSTLLENENLNATAFDLMKYLNVTHVFVGSYTSIFDMYKHKWKPRQFLQNPNFELVKRVGNAYLFAVSHQSPGIAFQEDFEYDHLNETGWSFYISEEYERTGFGEAAISSNDTYHGDKSLVITAERDKEWYYVCWVSRDVHIWDTANVTLSFYLNATSGFNNDLDHTAVIIADALKESTLTLSTPYTYISPEYIELSDSQGVFEYNLSELWHKKHNATLPNDFSISLRTFDSDGIENVVFFDYITFICN